MSLNIIAPDDPALKVLENSISKQPDLDVKLTLIPWSKYRDAMMQTLKEDLATNQALFIPGHIWLPELAEAGYLAELEPLLSTLPASILKEYDMDDIMPTITDECRYNNKTYQLPFFTDGHILFYDPNVIEFDNDTEVPIVSTKEIYKLASKAHNPPHIYGLALKADESEIFTDFLPYMWEEGGYIFDKNNLPYIDNDANITALQRYCELQKFCPTDTNTYGNDKIANTLKKGKVALVANWGGQSAPIFLDEKNPCKYKTALFEAPWNATWGVAIPKNQPVTIKQQTLSRLMQLLNKESDKQVTLIAGSPVRKSSYCIDELVKYPWLSAQKQMLKRAKILPKNPKLGLFLGNLYEMAHKAFTKKLSPKEALKTAQKEAMKHY